jgi:NitT/TauT family transport system permease protein
MRATGRSGLASFSGLIYTVAVLTLWEGLVRAAGVPHYFLPPPSVVVLLLFRQGTMILGHSAITFVEIVVGFLMGGALGAALAVAIHLYEPLRRTILPSLVALQSIPKVALAPLIVVWFGLGVTAKILMVILFCFFPVLMNMIGGLNRVEPLMLDLMGTYKANRWQTFRKVELPNCLPSVFDGLKVAMPLALIGAIVAEFTSAERGLGYLIQVASSQFDTPLTFGALFVLTVIALALFSFIRMAERRVVPWSAEFRRGQR